MGFLLLRIRHRPSFVLGSRRFSISQIGRQRQHLAIEYKTSVLYFPNHGLRHENHRRSRQYVIVWEFVSRVIDSCEKALICCWFDEYALLDSPGRFERRKFAISSLVCAWQLNQPV